MRTPTATYRLQFRAGFGFRQARDLVPYLDRLGVSDVYASPIQRARAGSAHGYDVVDPASLDPALGSPREFAAWSDELRRRGMGLILDLVPNHLAASEENPWWRDVLARGAASPHARVFDIRWEEADHAGTPAPRRRLLLPVLGRPYGEALERGELRLDFDAEGFVVRYFDRSFPVAYGAYAMLVEMEEHRSLAAARHPGRRLAALARRDASVRERVEVALGRLNGRAGRPHTFDALDALLAAQPYRLAFWRTAIHELDYRRFFDIADLVGVRVEDPEVARRMHELPLRLIAEGRVTGIRVDHVDGLLDPRGYLVALREQAQGAAGAPVYTVVEKILGRGETLPASWPVEGDTGYDFLNRVNGLFVNAAGLEELAAIERRARRRDLSFAQLACQRKLAAARELLPAEVTALASRLRELALGDRHGRDLVLPDLAAALAEVSARLPVYRTYLRPGEPGSQEDRRILRQTFDAARPGEPFPSTRAIAFLRRLLLDAATRGPDAPPGGEARSAFVQAWQQFTGPLAAKGIEDTAHYRDARLIALNEVGGEPDRGATPPAAFHRWLAERARRTPHGMNAGTTHDTKRSEDVRARLVALSEMPGRWERALTRWRRANARHRSVVEDTRVSDARRGAFAPSSARAETPGVEVPLPGEEMLVYQTLLGAWPIEAGELADFRKRMRAYLVKAAREAKLGTTWLRPRDAHEGALLAFLDGVLEALRVPPARGRAARRTPRERAGDERFRREFLALAGVLARAGVVNSLAQTLLRIAAPGVPDIYRGTELWDFSLVDPDNRRPVDFARRAAFLEALQERPGASGVRRASELLLHWQDGRVKLHLVREALSLRRTHAALFAHGRYLPLAVRGARREHVFAFARRRGRSWAIAAVVRCPLGLAGPRRFPVGDRAWGRADALLLPGNAPRVWTDVLTGERRRLSPSGRLPLRLLFSTLPVALLRTGR